MADDLKDSSAVTVMSVIGLVFGLIGMLGAFIPCLGSFAFFIGIPAAVVSGIALFIAYSQNAKKTFAIVALTISLIGVVVSGIQYFSIIGAGKAAKTELERMNKQSEPAPKLAPTPTPAQEPEPPQGPAPQIQVIQNTKLTPEEGLKIFYDMYSQAFIKLNWNEINSFKKNNDWKKIEIILKRGPENIIKIERPKYGLFFMAHQKKYKADYNCAGQFDKDYAPNNLTPGRDTKTTIFDEDIKFLDNLCIQIKFEPHYEDVDLVFYVSAEFADKYKLTLQNASIK